MKKILFTILILTISLSMYSQDYAELQNLSYTDNTKKTVIIPEFLVLNPKTKNYEPYQISLNDFYSYKTNPLGIRYFNFGCVKTKKSGFWLGQISKDKENHAIFKSPLYGIKTLITISTELVEKRKNNTLVKFFNVYAPSDDCVGGIKNNDGTCKYGFNQPEKYAKKIGDAIGIGVNDTLKLRTSTGEINTKLITLLISEVASFETGKICKFTEENVIKAINLNEESENLEKFIQKDLSFKTYQITHIYKDSTFKCDFKKVFLIEGTLINGKLFRTMIYIKKQKYHASNEFIKYCAKLVNHDKSSEFNINSTVEQNNKDFNTLEINFREELGYFAIRTVEEINPEDPNKSVAYFLKDDEFPSYNFPNIKECELK